MSKYDNLEVVANLAKNHGVTHAAYPDVTLSLISERKGLIELRKELVAALEALLDSVIGVPCGPEKQCHAALAKAKESEQLDDNAREIVTTQSTERIAAEPVDRTSDGLWMHSKMPEWDESTTYLEVSQWFNERGLEMGHSSYEWGSREDDEDPEEFTQVWQPEQPTGSGWFLLSIYETDDGLAALWARPKQHCDEAGGVNGSRS